MKKDQLDLVMVLWVDSRQPTSSWQWKKELKIEKAVRIKTVGWLIHNGNNEKVLASNISTHDSDGDYQINGVIVIPTRSIVMVTHLPDKKGRK